MQYNIFIEPVQSSMVPPQVPTEGELNLTDHNSDTGEAEFEVRLLLTILHNPWQFNIKVNYEQVRESIERQVGIWPLKLKGDYILPCSWLGERHGDTIENALLLAKELTKRTTFEIGHLIDIFLSVFSGFNKQDKYFEKEFNVVVSYMYTIYWNLMYSIDTCTDYFG